MSRPMVRLVVVAAAVAIGTWIAGWWAVPVIALVAGSMRVAPAAVALASAVAWAALLLIDGAAGSFTRLASVLSGVMGLPVAALVLVTILFPALLGWSAATIGHAFRASRPGHVPVQHPDHATLSTLSETPAHETLAQDRTADAGGSSQR